MSKMNPEVKAKWLEALRSGDYQQTTERLQDCGGFCCLGVLTDIYAKETGIGEWVVDEDGDLIFQTSLEEEGTILPEEVKAWAELDSTHPSIMMPDGYLTSLAELNDGGDAFTDIAEKIEAQY